MQAGTVHKAGAPSDTLIFVEGATGTRYGDDFIFGDAGGNVLNGAGGDDTLFGRGGDDTISGGRGDDALSGGAGSDRLDGRTGSDVMAGGRGADTFVFTSSFGELPSSDVITDFEAGLDLIDLSDTSLHSYVDLIGATSQVGTDVVIDMGDSDITLEDVMLSELSSGDFLF